jgi:hypothetical protein
VSRLLNECQWGFEPLLSTYLSTITQCLRERGRLVGKEGAMRKALEIPVPPAEELEA